MKLSAGELDELALLCHDMDRGIREQLNAEDDAKAARNMGKLMRTARMIAAESAAWFAAFLLFMLVVSLVGCNRQPNAADRMAALVAVTPDVLAEYAEAETADLKENDASFSDTEPDTRDQVRAREPAGPFADCPSTCIVKIGAAWCGPCRSEGITAWVSKSGWAVHAYDYDRDTVFCRSLGVDRLPTFIIVRGGREYGRYVGADVNGFRPVLLKACQ